MPAMRATQRRDVSDGENHLNLPGGEISSCNKRSRIQCPAASCDPTSSVICICFYRGEAADRWIRFSRLEISFQPGRQMKASHQHVHRTIPLSGRGVPRVKILVICQ